MEPQGGRLMISLSDALEMGVQEREKLERDKATLNGWVRYWKNRCRKTERSNAALRGVITKLKNKLAFFA